MKRKLIRFLSFSPAGGPRTSTLGRQRSLRSNVGLNIVETSTPHPEERARGSHPLFLSLPKAVNTHICLETWLVPESRNTIVYTHLCVFPSTVTYLQFIASKPLCPLFWAPTLKSKSEHQ